MKSIKPKLEVYKSDFENDRHVIGEGHTTEASQDLKIREHMGYAVEWAAKRNQAQ